MSRLLTILLFLSACFWLTGDHHANADACPTGSPVGSTCSNVVDVPIVIAPISSGTGSGNCDPGATADGCTIKPPTFLTLVARNGESSPHTWGFSQTPINGYWYQATRDGTPVNGCGGVDGGGFGTRMVVISDKIYTKGMYGWWMHCNFANGTWTGVPSSAGRSNAEGVIHARTHVTFNDPPWLTLPTGAAAQTIGINAPTSCFGVSLAPCGPGYAISNLTITIQTLPTNGRVTLAAADGGTSVYRGQILTSAQLTGLQFKPTGTANFPRSSYLTYTVMDPAESGRVGQASFTVLGAGLWHNDTTAVATGGPGYVVAPTIIQPSVTGDLVGRRISNPSGQAASNFTYGEIFHMGTVLDSDVTGTNHIYAKIGGSTPAYTQIDVRNHWPDGSVKHAMVSIKAPAFTSSPGYVEWMLAKCTGGGCPAAPPAAQTASQLQASGYNPNMRYTFSSGGSGTATANCNAALQAALPSPQQWLSGPLVNEYIVKGTVQGSLGFECDMRVYSDGSTMTDYISDNSRLFVPPSTISGGTQYNYSVLASDSWTNNGTAIAQFQRSLWHHEFASAGIVDPATMQIDAQYLARTGVVLPIDSTIPVGTNRISWFAGGAGGPMQAGNWSSDLNEGSGGPGSFIGPIHTQDAQWLMSQDPAAFNSMINNSEPSGSWPWNVTDSLGNPLNLDTYQQVPRIGGSGGGYNAETAHMPNPNWIPYIVTGRRYRLILLENISNFALNYHGVCNPDYGADSTEGQLNSLDPTGIVNAASTALYSLCSGGFIINDPEQPRGNAWSFRNQLETAFIVPDSDPGAAAFKHHVQREALGEAQIYLVGKIDEAYGQTKGDIENIYHDHRGSYYNDYFGAVNGLGSIMSLPGVSGYTTAAQSYLTLYQSGRFTHGPDQHLNLVGAPYFVSAFPGGNNPTNGADIPFNTWSALFENNISGCSGPATAPGCAPGWSPGFAGYDGTATDPFHPIPNMEGNGPGMWEDFPHATSRAGAVGNFMAGDPLSIQAFVHGVAHTAHEFIAMAGIDPFRDPDQCPGFPSFCQSTPITPDGCLLSYYDKERIDFSNGGTVTVNATATKCAIVAAIGNGNITLNGASGNTYEYMTAMTIPVPIPYPGGNQTFYQGRVTDAGVGSVVFNQAPTAASFQFGSCSPATFKSNSFDTYMKSRANCYAGPPSSSGTTAAPLRGSTFQILTSAPGTTQTIDNFIPGTDNPIIVAKNINGTSIQTAADVNNACSTRPGLTNGSRSTDTVCTFGTGVNAMTLLIKSYMTRDLSNHQTSWFTTQ